MLQTFVYNVALSVYVDGPLICIEENKEALAI